MKTIIHVNQHIIKSNRAQNKYDPVLTVKTYKSNIYAHEVEISGPARVVYSPDKPLSCGAHVWIETESEVRAKREWVGLDGEIPGLGLVTEEFYNGMIFAEDILKEKNT